MEQLFASLAKVVEDLAPDDRGRRAIVFAAWRRAAGHSIAAKAEAVDLEEGRLMIDVIDDTWVSHLKALAPEMLAKINVLVGHGTVTRIEFHSSNSKR